MTSIFEINSDYFLGVFGGGVVEKYFVMSDKYNI